jgi:hypothetical protein
MLGTQFLEALEADFNQFGVQAIALEPLSLESAGTGHPKLGLFWHGQ